MIMVFNPTSTSSNMINSIKSGVRGNEHYIAFTITDHIPYIYINLAYFMLSFAVL
jgi:hypothetical protein